MIHNNVGTAQQGPASSLSLTRFREAGERAVQVPLLREPDLTAPGTHKGPSAPNPAPCHYMSGFPIARPCSSPKKCQGERPPLSATVQGSSMVDPDPQPQGSSPHNPAAPRNAINRVPTRYDGRVPQISTSESALGWGGLNFNLPPALEASEPPEARGLARDQVRLMVSYRADNRIIHTQFRNFGAFLSPGDLLVINTSGTMNAALSATRADGTALELHLSTHLPADQWIVELRLADEQGSKPFYSAQVGETLHLPDGATVTLHAPYPSELICTAAYPSPPVVRLWTATLHLPCSLHDYLEQHGSPIRYSYVKQSWPASYYQTVYATELGGAEMPSAGRAFTPELITQLVAHGVQIAPLILHTGVASLEKHEPPYDEYYRVPPETAQLVNAVRAAGKRVIAVGTTVVRALETVTDKQGTTQSGEGWTRLIITPQRGLYAVNAMLTGLHEPEATHLAMLAALAGLEHLKVTYAEALREGYLWHEFGDLHLILP